MVINGIQLPPVIPMRVKDGVDRYGFSRVLSQRYGFRFSLRSFADWGHGWIWHDKLSEEAFVVFGMPKDMVYVVRNAYEKSFLVGVGFESVYVGGLPFAYVPRQINSRFSDALLAVPSHSSERERMTVDNKEYFDYLESIKGDYESVYVSLYSLDLGGPMHREALARGLRVVHGARPDDANSLIRSRALFDLFEFVTSNSMGGHMLYSLFSGCRFSFCGPFYNSAETISSSSNYYGHSSEYVRMLMEVCGETYLRKRFSAYFVNEPRAGIKDISFARKEIGVDSIMNKSQISEALGWSINGQASGYARGAIRRATRWISR